MMLLKLFLVFCVLLSIEVLSKDNQRRSKRSEERSYGQNFYKNQTDDEKAEAASPIIMNVLDPNNNPIGHLNLHLNGITNSLAQNEATLPNINILSDIPAQRAKLRSRAKQIRPPFNISDNKIDRLSKDTSTSRSKPKSNQANMNVSVLDSSSPDIIFKKDSVNIQNKRFKDSTADGEQTLNYEDIVKAVKNNLNLKQFSSTELKERQRVIFDTNNRDENYTDTLTKRDFDLINQNTNEISDGGYTIDRLIKVLLEQNNYLKKIIQTIAQRNDVTRKLSSKRIHVILDVKDFGNKTLDIELKPIIKCEDDNNNESGIKTPLADNRKWIRINTSEGDDYSGGIKECVPSETLDEDEARKSYLPYPYNNPILGASNQAFNKYKPNKQQSSYTNNNYWRHKGTPQRANNINLLRKDNKNTISKLSRVAVTDPPLCYHKTHLGVPTNNIRYYHRYFK